MALYFHYLIFYMDSYKYKIFYTSSLLMLLLLLFIVIIKKFADQRSLRHFIFPTFISLLFRLKLSLTLNS